MPDALKRKKDERVLRPVYRHTVSRQLYDGLHIAPVDKKDIEMHCHAWKYLTGSIDRSASYLSGSRTSCSPAVFEISSVSWRCEYPDAENCFTPTMGPKTVESAFSSVHHKFFAGRDF